MTRIREYEKLVRIKIPEIIRANGSTPKVTDAHKTSSNTITKFKEKIKEETAELIEAKSSDEILEEAADAVQVILDYIKVIGHSAEELEIVRLAKEVKRGSFLNEHGSGIYLVHVEDPE